MTQANPFDGEESTATTSATAVEDAPVTVDETESAVSEVEAVEPDADVDVDVDASAGEELETVDEAPPTIGKGATVKKVGTTTKVSARKPVADGYIAPVEAAKRLSEYLTNKARAAGLIKDDEEIEIRPQVMYSYIKNNGPTSKNPLPRYTDEALTGGRNEVLKLDEVIAWWDAKDARVAERKAGAKAKADKKAEKPAAGAVVEAEGEAPPAIVTEAE